MSEMRHSRPALDSLQQEAIAWVQRLASGQATADDAEALRRWRARSDAHAAAFAEAGRAWQEIEQAGQGLRRLGGEMPLSYFRARREAVQRRAFLGGGFAAAAAATAYAIVEPPLGLWPSLSELDADYRTRTGEQRNVVVAGDVAVRLNTQTSITVRSATDDGDRIELVAGEASFAAPQSNRSLIVLASDGRTIANGSRFDVRHMQDDGAASVCVTCFDGNIRVEQRGDTVTLQPGEQVLYGLKELGRVAAIDPEVVSAWQRGIVVFHATPLTKVVEEINRYRPGRIILLNAELGRQLVSGRFRIDDMNDILMRLQQAFDAKIRPLPGGVVLLS